MVVVSDEVQKLCDELQASVQESSGPLRKPKVTAASKRLAEAACCPEAWGKHRKQILEVTVQALAEPDCFPIILEALRWFVFPAALLLLGRLRSLTGEAPEFFERSMYVLSHLICDPCLAEHILNCLQQTPPPFHYVVQLTDKSEKAVHRCRLVCETVLRLLSFGSSLRKCWDWQPFHGFLAHPDEQVRCMAKVAWGHLVGLDSTSDIAWMRSNTPLLQLQPATIHSSMWRGSEGDTAAAHGEVSETVNEENLQTHSWEEGAVRSRHGICFQVADTAVPFDGVPFVVTEAARESMQSLLLAIAISKPVLVMGAAGVGKTAFLRRAAHIMGQEEPVFLFCDEQTDIKMLLGTYVCGQTVGEFVWQPGVITQSLTQGRWLVLEDVDRVPAEVLAALLPLADSRQLLLPDQNRHIDAHPDFRLFGTFSTGSVPLVLGPQEETGPAVAGSNPPASSIPTTSNPSEQDPLHLAESRSRLPPLVASWTSVKLSRLSKGDMSQIVSGLYPDLEPLCGRLLASAAALRDAEAADFTQVIGTETVGPRELLRWCAHLQHCKLVFTPNFTEKQRTLVLCEALMVFLGRVPDLRRRRTLLALLAPVFGLVSGVADALLEEQPVITAGETEVVIGTVILPRKPQQTVKALDAKRGGAQGAPFAYTSVHARVLHALAAAIRSNEPALLVGDTGTGKTSLVQHMGQVLGKEVVVYNFNEQSESTELIGGFRPLDIVMHHMTELMTVFTETFEQTFSRRKNAKLLERARADFVARRWQSLAKVIGSIMEKATQSLGDTAMQSGKGCKATQVTRGWEKVQELHAACLATLALGAVPRFEFMEGLLVKAMRTGAWVVLDEINLAPFDILQRIQGLIELTPGSKLALPESGDEHIIPHPDFRIFACMNPPRVPVPPAESFMPAAATEKGKADEEKKEAERPGIRAGHSAGKKELPSGVRARFTELFVDEVHTADDVGKVVRSYIELAFPNPPVAAIVGFYAQVMCLCRQCQLLDGAGGTCYFSLRNLTRALRFALCLVRRPRHASPAKEALAQGLAVGFATALDSSSRALVEARIQEALGASPSATITRKRTADGAVVPLSTEPVAEVRSDPDGAWLSVEGYWIRAGPRTLDTLAAHREFVITPSVRQHVRNIARMLSGGRFPILLEGPTSAGKTSLVRFLAQLTGHEFVRINNHEHTDLQEYIGQYVCDPMTGQLIFQEGVLVRAARAGHWVVLDELNLAPSEVLEALNRLLDDNRELYIPDTNTTVKPHEEFMIFATQNPAGGLYGGRKQLSRAFRNRFSEIYVSELPLEELQVVLHRRCELPTSFVREMLGVYKDLQAHRSQSAVFLGRQSFMTVRDLLRWGLRRPGSRQELAQEGYALLAERLRRSEDREVVQAALLKHCVGIKELCKDYSQDPIVKELKQLVEDMLSTGDAPPSNIGNVVWTPAFCRMCALIGRCMRADEPVLLVGETGGGKTMACQLLSWALVEKGVKARQLSILNCHQQTETADFIGSLRPVRGREGISAAASKAAAEILRGVSEETKIEGPFKVVSTELYSELELVAGGAGDLKSLSHLLRKTLVSVASEAPEPSAEAAAPPAKKAKMAEEEAADRPTKRPRKTDAPSTAVPKVLPSTLDDVLKKLLGLCVAYEQIFEWSDGSLVQAMRSGAAFLIDEISLAEDSVLERLNSVLEPDHTLMLAEKPLSGPDLEVVRADSNFRLMATMNPGGDFGKRELSPALRNRFTEVWVEAIDFRSPEAESLVAGQLPWPLLAKPMISAVLWFNQRALHPLTIREVLGWSSFIKKTTSPKCDGDSSDKRQLAVEMYLHGGCMVLVDSVGLGNQIVLEGEERVAREKHGKGHIGNLSAEQFAVLQYLLRQLDDQETYNSALTPESCQSLREAFGMGGFAWVQQHMSSSSLSEKGSLQFGNFQLLPATEESTNASTPSDFAFDFRAPSTSCNIGRIVRALQQPKAVLLEGPPGLGKTASVQALAQFTGRKLLRINLSEQTDLQDLLGTDLPVSGGEAASFRWQDGPVLRAMRCGDWVLLDEINLAPQATLEGLNALLDHRREVFLPAIGQTVVAHPGFRLFAAQNPVASGGGRKGLPRSFLNRFTRIVLASLSQEDLRHICRHCHSGKVQESVIDAAVGLVEALREASCGEGGAQPFDGHLDWDWNLRDALRLCGLLEAGVPLAGDLGSAAELLLFSRLRRPSDREAALVLLRKHLLPLCQQEASDIVPKGGNFSLMETLAPALRRRDSQLKEKADPADMEDDSSKATAAGLPHSMPELFTGAHSVKLSPTGLQIGAASLRHKLPVDDARKWQALDHLHNTRHLTVIPSQVGVLHVMAQAVSDQLKWPVLLVGGPASGKRSIVRHLAAAVRVPLREVSLTPALDASELLGYFEQVGVKDELLGIAHPARDAAEAMSRVLLLHSGTKAKRPRSGASSSSATAPSAVLPSGEPSAAATSSSTSAADVPSSAPTVPPSGTPSAATSGAPVPSSDPAPTVPPSGTPSGNGHQLAVCIQKSAELIKWSTSSAPPELQTIATAVVSLLSSLQQCQKSLFALTGQANEALSSSLAILSKRVASFSSRKSSAGRFKWVDGPLVTALQEGTWVLLSHADQASPSVLDRLNSLLEPDGFLMLTESGEERMVRPHPDFRIFFTVTLGGSKATISRALRNRCIEISVDMADSKHAASAHEQKESGEDSTVEVHSVPQCLNFLQEALNATVTALAEKKSTVPSFLVAPLTWAHSALTSSSRPFTWEAIASSGATASTPLSVMLVDAARIVGAQAPIQASLVMQIAALHVLANVLWAHLRKVLLHPSPEKSEAPDHDSAWQEALGRHLMSSTGFSWHALTKFVALFLECKARSSCEGCGWSSHGGTSSRQAPHSDALQWSFLQAYLPEVSGAEVEESLLVILLDACTAMQSTNPSFSWLADAVGASQKAVAALRHFSSTAETEVRGRYGALLASAKQAAGTASPHTLELLQLFLERASVADADLHLNLLAELDEHWLSTAATSWATRPASTRLLRHPLISEITPKACLALVNLLGVQRLHGAEGFSIRDAWALSDCSLAIADRRGAASTRLATHLQGLLRCARELSSYMLRQPQKSGQQQQSAWVLSQRFQEGVVPLSSMPHPVLSVAHSLLSSCFSSLESIMGALSAVPPAASLSDQSFHHLQLALAVAHRLQELLEGVIFNNNAEDSSHVAAVWAQHEARVLCLFQQLFASLTALPASASAHLQEVHGSFRQLAERLVERGMVWEPDARRLHTTLLPLTDTMNSWGGLAPPLRTEQDFLFEQAVLAVSASGSAAKWHSSCRLAVTAKLLAVSLVRRQHGSAGQSSLSSILSSPEYGSTLEKLQSASTSANDEPSTVRMQQTFLVLESVQVLWSVVGADLESVSLSQDAAQFLGQALRKMDNFDDSLSSGGSVEDGVAVARSSLAQAVAQLYFIQWVTGGDTAWFTEESLLCGSPTKCPDQPAAATRELLERSLFALRWHLQNALAAVCTSLEPASTSTPVGLSFMLSPATLTWLRAPGGWQVDQQPSSGALMLASGFKCAWALNLCSIAVSSTDMANHGWHRSLLENILKSCFDESAGDCQPTASSRASYDWVAVCKFVAAQFHGLELMEAETQQSAWKQGGGATPLLTAVGLCLGASQGNEGRLLELSKSLAALRDLVLQAASDADEGMNSTKQKALPWPMRLPDLAKQFVIPLLDLLQKRCTTPSDDDTGLRGTLWTLASMWRLHSGGGSLVPGGMDASEVAAQTRAELQHKASVLEGHLEAHGSEAIAVDGSWHPGSGSAADLSRTRSACTTESEDLATFCRLRPPLAEASVPQSLSAVRSVATVCAGKSSSQAAYQDLCQEMIAFSTTVATPERILQLLTRLKGEANSQKEQTSTMAELHHLNFSALSFLSRMEARFPLHADLVGPMALAVHGLLHGLHLVHHHLWVHVPGRAKGLNPKELIGLPQLPTFSEEILEDADERAAEDASCPEVAKWWLQWLGIARMQRPKGRQPVTRHAPRVALEMLQALSRRHHDEETQKEVAAVESEAPFKVAKTLAEAAQEAEAEEVDEAEQRKALFPGADREEVIELIGLNNQETAEEMVVDESAEKEGRPGGESLYDFWKQAPGPAELRKKRRDSSTNWIQDAQKAPIVKQELQEQQIVDICNLSLTAFAPETGGASARELAEKEVQTAEALRVDALDASLELFVYQSVVSVSALEDVAAAANLLPSETSVDLMPLVMLRLSRNLTQLRPGSGMVLSTESALKRSAGQASLHRGAACAFYSECNPSILLQLAAPLDGLLKKTRELLEEFEDYPALLNLEYCIGQVQRLRLLRTTPMAVTTMLELLLDRASIWEQVASSKVTLKAQLRPLESLLVSLRERQLLEWKDLCQVRLRHWEREASKCWLQLVGMLNDDADEPRKLVDGLMRFLRISPLGQFKVRLRMLLAASHMHREAEGASLAAPVAFHVYHYARKWLPVVEKALSTIHEKMEKEVRDLVKIVRWDLSNFRALKDSVSRSHMQLNRVIRRFDESLQGLVDTVLTENADASDLLKMVPSPDLPGLDTSGYLIAESMIRTLQVPAGLKPQRLEDTEEFWASATNIRAAVPGTLENFVKVISKNIMQDLFCIAMPEGCTIQDAMTDLTTGAAASSEEIQKNDSTEAMKRRRLGGLRELCTLHGILPKPMTKDALDVMDYFSAPVAPPAAERPSNEVKAPTAGEGSETTAAFEAFTASIWSRLESLKYVMVHLALRLHATNKRPPGLSGADVNQWLGIAAACIQAVRCHRERCEKFHTILRGFSSFCGATMTEQSTAIEHRFFPALYKGLEQCLEGTQQARLMLKTITADRPSAGKTAQQILDEAAQGVRSTLEFLVQSDDFLAYYASECSREETETVRVRVTFLQSVLEQVKGVVGTLEGGTPDLQKCLPMAVTDRLRAMVVELNGLVKDLEHNCEPAPASSPGVEDLRALRELLLAVQVVKLKLPTDPSLSVTAAASNASATSGKDKGDSKKDNKEDSKKDGKDNEDSKTDGDKEAAPANSAAGEAEAAETYEEEEEDALPQLGLGRLSKTPGLLELLPLDRILSSLRSHVSTLPRGVGESPLAPFAWQSMLLARAVLRGGLEVGLAAAESSVSLMQFVCHLFEKGLGKKEEEEQDGDEGGQQSQWQTGTGMGEGEGMKDVTDEIEDDNQLEGTKDEKQEEQKKPEVPQEKDDTAREVGFGMDDQEAQAVPKEDKPEEKDDKEKKEEEDIDREKGDVDLNDGGTLDDKLWNGEEDKEEKEEKDNKPEKDDKQKEEIEAHGAKGEGEGDNQAKEEEGDSGTGKERDAAGSKDKEQDKQEAEDEKKKPDEEDPDGEEDPGQTKTEWNEEDAQFDVNMQKEGPGGQNDANAPSDCDLDSEFVNDEGLESEGGEGDGDGDGDGKSEGEQDLPDGVVDIDNVRDEIPQIPDEEEKEGERQDQAVEKCTEAPGNNPEEQEQPEQEKPKEEEGQEQKKDKPSIQGDAGDEKEQKEAKAPTAGEAAASAGETKPAPETKESQEPLFGGASGASTSFDNKTQESEGTGEKKQQEQGQGTQAAPAGADQQQHSAPSAAPGQGAAQESERPDGPQKKEGETGKTEERQLKKVDLLKEEKEGEDGAGGDESNPTPAPGLHRADPKSAAEALGECNDPGQDQAMGVAEEKEDGEAGNEGEEGAMIDEQKQDGKPDDQSFADMRFQELDPNKHKDSAKLQMPDELGEQDEDAAKQDGQRGSANLTNIVVAQLPALRNAVPEEPSASSAPLPEQERQRRQRPEAELRQLWSNLERSTSSLASTLCEQLRIILEPTLKGRLQGFYRTGKRISMRRVIPFIASSYRRDKIWLRRTKPSKREYQVIVAIDNSRSMHECGVGQIALQTLAVICQALSHLEVGEYGVLSFGSSAPRMLLPLGQGEAHCSTFGWEQARPVLDEFTFDEESAESHNRSFVEMMKLGSEMFDERAGAGAAGPFCQMMLIISDGRFNKAKVRSWVHAALARQQLPLLIIVDKTAEPELPAGKSPQKKAGRSVFDVKAVSYEGGQCTVVPYLQDFPFPYYIVVQDLQALPNILSDVMKQWFELAAAS